MYFWGLTLNVLKDLIRKGPAIFGATITITCFTAIV